MLDNLNTQCGGDYGVASATALIMLAITLLLTWRYVRLVIKQGDL